MQYINNKVYAITSMKKKIIFVITCLKKKKKNDQG